jgi:hypothetical protein
VELEGRMLVVEQSSLADPVKIDVLNNLKRSKKELEFEIERMEDNRTRQRRFRERQRRRLSGSKLNLANNTGDFKEETLDILIRILSCNIQSLKLFLHHHQGLLLQNQDAVFKLFLLRHKFNEDAIYHGEEQAISMMKERICRLDQ